MAIVADGTLAAAVVLSGAVAYGALRNRPRRGSYTLAATVAAAGAWALFHLLEHHAPAAAEPYLGRLQWLGVGPLGFLWLAFAVAYVGRRDLLTRGTAAALLAWPAAINAAVWLSPGIRAGLEAEAGAVFWAHVLLSWGALAAGAALLLRHALGAPRPFRSQLVAVVAGAAVLLAASALAVFDVPGVHFHALPVGTALAGLALLWAVYREGVTDFTPVAGRAVLEAIPAGVLVVDDRGRVARATDRARTLLGLDPDAAVVGRELGTVLGGDADPAIDPDPLLAADGGTAVTRRVGDRVVEVRAAETGAGPPAGRALVLLDVTDRERRKRRLRRQNERLEEFAGVVSHDLRNPLGVASGYLEAGRDAVDGTVEAFDEVAAALDRMEAIVDDVLTVARYGEAVESTDRVGLAAAAREAWSNVPTREADLVVEADGRTVAADRSRLLELFENCFANAVEHGGSAVTVTVEAGEGWFAVADDGAGLPEEAGDLFETGVTTDPEGTGFGLGIVETVCSAHGWTVEAGEGPAGGARFEVSGVETAGGRE